MSGSEKGRVTVKQLLADREDRLAREARKEGMLSELIEERVKAEVVNISPLSSELSKVANVNYSDVFIAAWRMIGDEVLLTDDSKLVWNPEAVSGVSVDERA